MTEHLSTEIVERFHHHALALGDRSAIYDHVLKCNACRERIIDSSTEPLALQALSHHLVPSNFDERFHLDSQLVEGYVEDNLDDVDRERTEMHLQRCIECSAEVTDFRESLATMRAASIQPHVEQKSLRERLLAFTRVPVFGSPLRVTAIVALAALALIAIVVVWRFKSTGSTPTPVGKNDLSAESQPRPLPSPLSPQADVSPSPSQNMLAESPITNSTEPRQEILGLSDGPNRITLAKSGKLIGLESLPRETQEAVREALTAQKIKRPDVLDELSSAAVSLRAPAGNDETVRIVYPANTVIAADRPQFEWIPASKARAYSVELGDAGFHQVAKSENLPPTTRSWTPSAPLKRGMSYTWVVRVINQAAEGTSVSLASQGKFKVLEEEKIKELNQLKTASQSHLALGVFYAREGIIAEAEHEFQILAKENPRSKIVKKLLREIQSWQRH